MQARIGAEIYCSLQAREGYKFATNNLVYLKEVGLRGEDGRRKRGECSLFRYRRRRSRSLWG